MTTEPASRLTEEDRRVIEKARELAALATPAAVREQFPGWGGEMLPAYAEAFATARYVLGELAAIAGRLLDILEALDET
jgi:hypothetical protein